MSKYAIVPGLVRARDGDVHFIDARRLMELYGVDPRDCKVLKDEAAKRGYRKEFLDSLIWLYPRDDGDYSLEHPTNQPQEGNK